jgi:hypothetical protein
MLDPPAVATARHQAVTPVAMTSPVSENALPLVPTFCR